MCGFCDLWVCMCGFCDVWVCVCGTPTALGLKPGVRGQEAGWEDKKRNCEDGRRRSGTGLGSSPVAGFTLVALSCPFVCPPHWTDFRKIWYCKLFERSVGEIWVWLISVKYIGLLTWRHTYCALCGEVKCVVRCLCGEVKCVVRCC